MNNMVFYAMREIKVYFSLCLVGFFAGWQFGIYSDDKQGAGFYGK
ncbi:MAG: hypothetical protein PHD12_09485 [Methylotenera sp.]|nr:hypothetical protein [Methylotenera sp.]